MSAKLIKGDDLVFALGSDSKGTFTKGGITKRELFALAFAVHGNYSSLDMEYAWQAADMFIETGNGAKRGVEEKQT